MNSYSRYFVIWAIFLVIGIVYKRYLEFNDDKSRMLRKDNNVYKAAERFAAGASLNEVKNILINCFDLSEENAEDILTRSSPHKTDKDGGYRFFIRSVNKEVGENVYEEKYHIQ